MSTTSAYELTTAVMATADVFLRESQRLFRPYGLTAAQYNVLNVLGPRDDGMSQRELGDVLVVDRSNVTGLLDRMEKAGWVRRADDPADRRVYRITLTPSGRRLWRKIEPRYLAAIAQVTAGISAQEMAACTELLNRLAQQAANWNVRVEGKS
jgi:DNA-binding MarR family transcriptional regulator